MRQAPVTALEAWSGKRGLWDFPWTPSCCLGVTGESRSPHAVDTLRGGVLMLQMSGSSVGRPSIGINHARLRPQRPHVE